MTRPARRVGKPDCFRVDWLTLPAGLVAVAGLAVAASVCNRLA
jgi:hypothetical protein